MVFLFKKRNQMIAYTRKAYIITIQAASVNFDSNMLITHEQCFN